MRLFGGDASADGNDPEDTNRALDAHRELNREIRSIKKRFLTVVDSRKKHVLKAERKADLIKELEALVESVEEAKSRLQSATLVAYAETLREIAKYVLEHLSENPPVRVRGLEGRAREAALRLAAKKILDGIRMPDPEEVVGQMKLRWAFYDPTWEDFSDNESIGELKKAGLIDDETGLGEVFEAIRIRRHSRTVV